MSFILDDVDDDDDDDDNTENCFAELTAETRVIAHQIFAFVSIWSLVLIACIFRKVWLKHNIILK